MSDYQFSISDYDLAGEMFRHAIEANLAEEENYAAIEKAFRAEAGAAWKGGSFKVEIERLVVDHLWQRMNNRAGAATTKFLRDVATGGTSLDVQEWLDTPITVGKHRRTTIRHYDHVDNERAQAERAENLKRQEAAFAIASEAASRLTDALNLYGDIPTWIASEVGAMDFEATA